MNRLTLGELYVQGKVLRVEEEPCDTLALKPTDCHTVTLSFEDNEVELDLAAIRKARQILARAEQRLLLRQEQALRARNMKLDFESQGEALA